MRTNLKPMRGLAVGVSLLLLSACDRRDDQRAAQVDSAAGVIAKLPIETAADRADARMAVRREAQSMFDAARRAYEADSSMSAMTPLLNAAGFIRAHGDSSTGDARMVLRRSADELEALAMKLPAPSKRDLRRLDETLARAQFAEAQYHRQRALSSWGVRDMGITAAELAMTVDHYERALQDAGRSADMKQRTLIEQARALVAKLDANTLMPAADVDRVLTALGDDIAAQLR